MAASAPCLGTVLSSWLSVPDDEIWLPLNGTVVLKLNVVSSNASEFSGKAVVPTGAMGAAVGVNLLALPGFCFLLFGLLRRPPFFLLELGRGVLSGARLSDALLALDDVVVDGNAVV